jgi:hypothetical protein
VELARANIPETRKRAGTDLSLILLVTFLILGSYMVFQSWFSSFVRNESVHILARTLVTALIQFGVTGLGISFVSVIRKDNFSGYGLRIKGIIPSIVFSVLMYVPYTAFVVVKGTFEGYMPFRSVWVTNDILAAGFPLNVAGMLLVAAAWGFFEGFNYVVISKKINTIFPPKNMWLNWGAILCGVMCILIHGMVGVSLKDIIVMISAFIVIYGMLVVKERTGNAWGSVFVFVFLWNAF